MKNWQVSINLLFVKYVLTAVASFILGCLTARLQTGRIDFVGNEIKKADNQSGFLTHAKYSPILFFFIPVCCTCLFVILMFIQARNAGTGGNIFRTIYTSAKDNSSSFFVHQLREIVVAIAEISIMEIMVIKYANKTRVSKGFLIPIACFALCALFSTDRNIFLRFIIYAICLWVFFFTSMRETRIQRTNKQIAKKTIMIIAVAIGVFYLLGKVKSYTSNLERMIGIYGGSGLYNFNLYLEKVTKESLQYGRETFYQFFSSLRVFGIDISGFAPNDTELGMVIFASPNGYIYASNIYSAMMPYVRDFGYLGVIIFPFSMSCLFEKIYLRATKMKSAYCCGLYSILIYAVVYFSMVEQFFNRFHLGMVYEIGWFSIIYFVAFGRYGREVKQYTVFGDNKCCHENN